MVILAIFSQLTNSATNHFSAQSYLDNLLFFQSPGYPPGLTAIIEFTEVLQRKIYYMIKAFQHCTQQSLTAVSMWHLVETSCPWDQSDESVSFCNIFKPLFMLRKKKKKAENSLLQGSCNYTSFPLKLVQRRRHRWKKKKKKVPRGHFSLVSTELRPNIWVCIKRRNWM